MPSAVWSGHLHFRLVVMPVRLLVAARPKTTGLADIPSEEKTARQRIFAPGSFSSGSRSWIALEESVRSRGSNLGSQCAHQCRRNGTRIDKLIRVNYANA